MSVYIKIHGGELGFNVSQVQEGIALIRSAVFSFVFI